ncbi:MAG: hypothetical protein KKH83_07990 [Candidatus Margulisbacteria bacterium]|nr:hypothetical protein [Candidatus Margulisiibacteriota bacterium]
MELSTTRQSEIQKIRKEYIPFLFNEGAPERNTDKIDVFEKGLANEIFKSDTIEQAVTKIVKMAIASEFGVSLVKAKGSDAMIGSIVTGILSDSELRKQALLIIDRYAKE